MTAYTDEATHYRAMQRYANKFFPGLSADDRQDLLHEAYARVANTYPERRGFFPHNLLKLAMQRIVLTRHEASKAFGGNRANPLHLDRPDPVTGEAVGSYIPARHDTEREALTNLDLAGILDRMGDYRVRTLLRLATGYTWAEAGAAEGVSHDAIGNRVHVARRTLKEAGYAQAGTTRR